MTRSLSISNCSASRGPARARTMAYFGEGRGPIHLDNVQCTGGERSLADCLKQEIGSHNCRHSEDAGVICDYFGKKAPGNSNKGHSPPGLCSRELQPPAPTGGSSLAAQIPCAGHTRACPVPLLGAVSGSRESPGWGGGRVQGPYSPTSCVCPLGHSCPLPSPDAITQSESLVS